MPAVQTPGTTGRGIGTLAGEVVRLGEAAKGYRWAATGPDYYDCSGLVYRALTNLGIYHGVRFSTYTIQSAGFQRVSTPEVGDIVVWPTHHMGVVTGDNQMYSAKSPSAGIGFNTISGDSAYFHSAPVYYRTKGSGGNPISGAIGAVVGATPLGQFGQAASDIHTLVSVASFFANPANWIRAAMFSWGIGLVIVGLVMARHGMGVVGATKTIAKTGVKTVRKVAA